MTKWLNVHKSFPVMADQLPSELTLAFLTGPVFRGGPSPSFFHAKAMWNFFAVPLICYMISLQSSLNTHVSSCLECPWFPCWLGNTFSIKLSPISSGFIINYSLFCSLKGPGYVGDSISNMVFPVLIRLDSKLFGYFQCLAQSLVKSKYSMNGCWKHE